MSVKEKMIQSYNFGRPDLISSDQLRSLQVVHDRFARSFGSSISAYLRTMVEVSLETVEQVNYGEFLTGGADPACYAAISLKPLDGLASLELTPQLVFPMIDRLLGGSGQALQTIRPMTEIEQNLMQKMINLLVDNLKESWKPVYAADFAAAAMKTQRQMVQVAAPNEMVIHFEFHVQMRQAKGKMHLAIPTLALAPIIHVFDQECHGRKEVIHDEALLLHLRNIPVNVTIETAETQFPMQSLLSLQVGDTLVLDQRQEWPVQLKVCGRNKLQAAPRMNSSKKSFVVSGHSRPVREEEINGNIC